MYLRICASSEDSGTSLGSFWIAKDVTFLHADNENLAYPAIYHSDENSRRLLHTVKKVWTHLPVKQFQLKSKGLQTNIWATAGQSQENVMCAQRGLYQPGHPPSLIRVFAVCSSFLHADSEDSDQIWRMPRLICLCLAHMSFCRFCRALAHFI